MKNNINIFISCHKKFNTLNNEIFKPIQVGTSLNKPVDGIMHDNDSEDNISNKNKKYCEMTAVYYVWKNLDKFDCDYIGFFHYRRYLSFSDKAFKKTAEGYIVEKTLSNEVVEKHYLNEKAVCEMVNEYDLILPEKRLALDIKRIYSAATTQSKTDIDFCFNYVHEKYPYMRKALKKYSHAFMGYFCNMFIMKKDMFNSYCEWLFDILQAHEKAFDVEHYDVQSYRVSGYLAERLTGVYFTWLMENKHLKVKHLPTLMFDDVNIKKPVTEYGCKILLKTDKKDYLKTNILVNSIANNCSDEKHYLIKIQCRGLLEQQKCLLKAYARNNIVIEIVDYIKAQDVSNGEKYIYISNDCIVNSDLYELYTQQAVEGTYCIKDILKFGKTKLHKQAKMLKKNNPYDKIDSNVKLLNNGNSSKKFDLCWNYQVNTKVNYTEKIYSFASHAVNDEYLNAQKSPKIITYLGNITPLNCQYSERADLFWKYAKTSNVYESIIRHFILHTRRIKLSMYDKLFKKGTTSRLLIKTYIKKY